MTLGQDIRIALRTMRRAPAVTVLVVLTLAVGIAANGLFFASIYGSAFRPLPFERPDELVLLNQTRPALGEGRLGVSAPNLRDWTERTDVFEAVGAYADRSHNLMREDEPARVLGCAVSAEMLPVLGVGPALGRHFTRAEDAPGGPAVVLLGHDLWQERFAGDPHVVGKTVRLDGQVREIVGVMPEDFAFPYFAELWTPLQLDPDASARDDMSLGVIARLRQGTSLETARQALEGVAAELEALYPETNRGSGIEANVLREGWIPTGAMGRIAAASQMVLFVGLLLIICANVTGIVLAQATARRREWALRLALGAGRWQVSRLILVESALLALFGGILGATLASRSNLWLEAIIPTRLPYWMDFSLGVRGVAYIVFVTVLAGLAIGLLPAWRGARSGLFDDLKSGTGRDIAGRSRLHTALIVAEYAVAVVILVQGLLMVRNFQNLRAADRGFDSEHVLTLQLPLDGADFTDPQSRMAILEEVTSRLEALPAVAGVGLTDALPYLPVPSPVVTSLGADGAVFPEGDEPWAVDHLVSSAFFDAFGLPLVHGRTFTVAEMQEGADRVIVSESIAELLWPGADAIGRRLRVGPETTGGWMEVVGVVGDIEPGQMIPGFGTMPKHRVYLPLAGTETASVAIGPPLVPSLIVSTRSLPLEVIPDVRSTLLEVAPTLPLTAVMPMTEVLDEFYFAQHFWNRIFSGLAFLTLLIAGVGVYGVTRYGVSRRVREMGIRLAVGASPGSVLALVVRRGLVLALAGSLLGLLGAVPLALAMESLLHDMRGLDIPVFASVLAGLLLLGLLASFFPARRAAAIDPSRTLRQE